MSAKVRFKSYNTGIISIFPVDLGEKIPKNAPVRLIDGIVDGLKLDKVIETYKDGGTTPYHPRVLLKVVFYAYMNNVYSCRRIASLLDRDFHYMWLSGGQTPSFSTINRFRSEHLKDAVNDLFVQVVMKLVEAGQLSLDVQYIDGTKIESVANRYTFVWKKTTERNKARLEGRIRGILSQIDEGIAQDSIPAEDTSEIDPSTLQKIIEGINETTSRKEKEGAGKRELNKRRKAVKQLQKAQEKLAEYEDRLDTLGDRNSYAKTDPDATFMHMKEDAMRNGQTKPGYNVQISTENQYITVYDFFPNPTDTLTLPSYLQTGFDLYGRFPDTVCADSGYGSEQNYDVMEQMGIEAYVKYNWFHKEQHRPFREDAFRQENLFYNAKDDYFVCPMGQHMVHTGRYHAANRNGYRSTIDKYTAANCEGCPLRCRCFKAKGNRTIHVNHRLNRYKRRARELLLSEEGLMHRSRRPIEPEAAFGQIKFNKQYRRFRHRGLDKVKMDFALLAMSFNIQKLWRNLTRKTTNAPTGTSDSDYGAYKANIRPNSTKFEEICQCECPRIKMVA
jgi:transposase